MSMILLFKGDLYDRWSLIAVILKLGFTEHVYIIQSLLPLESIYILIIH